MPLKRWLSDSSFVTGLLWLIRLSIFGGLVVLVYFAYRISVDNIAHGSLTFGIVLFWALTAYITIPRIHRQLTKFYLPDYFIGRVRTADGLMGDPVNLAVLGSARDLRIAMERAGWAQAEKTSLSSAVRMIISVIFKRSYPTAPVSALFLFSQRQTLAFQKEVEGNPRKRHHVRFWKTPENWWLPGGYQADWLGAATFDKHVGISLFTGQITHRIAENVDEERDYVIASLKHGGGQNVHVHVHIVKNFSSGFHGRSAGGDRIRTDGAMPFINLSPAFDVVKQEPEPLGQSVPDVQ